ncbi:MAG: aspartate dehydrogenase [Candidatus Omnitrophota bacterium]
MIKIGIVGCGTIGSYIAKTVLNKYKKRIYLVGVCDQQKQSIINLNRSLKKNIKSYSLHQLIKKCDLVIEAACGEAARIVTDLAADYGKDVMIMSVGGLLLNPQVLKKVEQKKIKLYVPSGAIAGLDALKAARMGKITEVKLTTKKPLAGLKGADYLQKHNIDLKKIKNERIIFAGSAQEAVKGFPKNINVAAILSLVGLGAKKTQVCIIASAKIKRNTHTIEIKGDFGKIICCTENVPSNVNPKTSMLAILSAQATLEGILNNIKIGT